MFDVGGDVGASSFIVTNSTDAPAEALTADGKGVDLYKRYLQRHTIKDALYANDVLPRA